MAGYIDRYTEAQVAAYSKKIKGIYGQAAKEVRKKLDDFLAGQKVIGARMLEQVKRGEITEADYKKWLSGQVFIGDRWKAKLAEITDIYMNADRKAREMLGGTTKQVFAESANRTAYDMSKDLRGAVSFNLYDTKTVDRLLKDDPKMLPEWKINEKKDYIWNEKRVRNSVTQGIIQGESVYDIGKRLTSELATDNADKMDMFARTAVTGAQNAGRVERMKETEESGIKVKKKWIAAHDNRTRDTHADLDGQEVDVDEKFKTFDGREIDYPGDPTADPDLVYNCRCTLVYVYPKYEPKTESHHFESYSEWKAKQPHEEKRTRRAKKEEQQKEEQQELKQAKQEERQQEPELHELSFDEIIAGWDESYKQDNAPIKEVDDSYGQFGIKEADYPKDLQYTKAEKEYVEGMDKFWHDEKNAPKDFDFNQEVSWAISGNTQPTDETFERLEGMKEQYRQKAKEAEEVIEERKASGYKGASRSENWQKWQALKQDLRGADEFERGDYLAAARVGERGVRYWQIERKNAQRKIEQLELAEKILRRRKYAGGG